MSRSSILLLSLNLLANVYTNVSAQRGVDPGFGVEPPVDPGFGVEPPVDPGFGVDPPVDPGFGVDPAGPPQNCMQNSCPVFGKGGYCDAKGNCLKVGLCTKTADCFNVYNDPYPVNMCLGDIICDRGRCVTDCDPTVKVKFGQCKKLDNPITIADMICEDPDLKKLCSLMKDMPVIKEMLSDPKGTHTLFAPVDKGWKNVPYSYGGYTYNNGVDFTYHIVNGASTWSFDIDCKAGNNLVTMMNGKDTRTLCSKGIPDIQQGQGNKKMGVYPKFLSVDNIACNGMVHKISEVLLFKPDPNV